MSICALKERPMTVGVQAFDISIVVNHMNSDEEFKHFL